MLAKVAVSAATYEIDKPFDYYVPPALANDVKAGVCVTVPFGRGNRKCSGIVLSVDDGGIPADNVKPIVSVIYDAPEFTEEMIKLALFMSNRYFCTFFDAARLLVPNSVWTAPKELFVPCGGISKETALSAAGKSEIRRDIVSFIFDTQKPVTSLSIARNVKNSRISEHLKFLENAGVIVRQTKQMGASSKTEKIVCLSGDLTEVQQILSELSRKNPKYESIIEYLSQNGACPQNDLRSEFNISSALLSTMSKKGLINICEQRVYRRPNIIKKTQNIDNISLNDEQKTAVGGLEALMNENKPHCALLYGVTGSGKTMVYIELIRKAVSDGKGVIVLVPEISLTPRLLSDFTDKFGDAVAVLHSGLSAGERADEWQRLKNGEAKIAVGARSAVFAPVDNLGLIIIDEEQEHTFKAEDTPRYDAREVARYLCAKNNALLVLGSATPSVESFYKAKSGIYSLFTLSKRFFGTMPPEAIIADMRGVPNGGEAPVIGSVLRGEMEKTLFEGKQIILFLNRRGASKQIICSECGNVPTCVNCSAPLRYHSFNGRLMCHYCGYSVPAPRECPACGSAHLRLGSAGTQRAEEEIKKLFPFARVIRMDADTTSAKNSHEKILSEFAGGKADILIGTQMIAKGLDFENVALSGIIDADMALFGSDFRAAEQTFSMIAQVIGRCGRRNSRGRAVIQTYCPENTIIKAAAAQDYDSFYKEEIERREALRLPPNSDFIALTLSGMTETKVLDAGMRLVKRITSLMDGQYSNIKTDVLGPQPAAVTRINGKYRYHIVFRAGFDAAVRRFIAGIVKEFMRDKANRGIMLYADKNPYDM